MIRNPRQNRSDPAFNKAMTKTATAEDYHKYHAERWHKMDFHVRVMHQYNYIREVALFSHEAAMKLIDGETPPENLVPKPSFYEGATKKIQDEYLYDN